MSSRCGLLAGDAGVGGFPVRNCFGFDFSIEQALYFVVELLACGDGVELGHVHHLLVDAALYDELSVLVGAGDASESDGVLTDG